MASTQEEPVGMIGALRSLAPSVPLAILQQLAMLGDTLQPPITAVEQWSLAFLDGDRARAWARNTGLADEHASALALIVTRARPFEEADVAVHGARLAQHLLGCQQRDHKSPRNRNVTVQETSQIPPTRIARLAKAPRERRFGHDQSH